MIVTAPTAALHRYTTSADPEAFRELLVAYRPMVFGVCVRVLADAAMAEDATQETFVLLSKHAWTIRTSVGAWLYACALNEARRLRREELARHRRERESELRFCEEKPQYLDALDSDECELLNRCIADLPDAERNVITLSFFLGQSQDEIALRYGMSQPAVKKRIDKALRLLRYDLVRRGIDLPGLLASQHHLARGPQRQRMLGLGLALCGYPGFDPCGLGSFHAAPLQLTGVHWAANSAPLLCGLIMTASEQLSGRPRDRRFRTSSRWLPQRIANVALDVLHVAREVADLLLRLVGGLFRPAPRSPAGRSRS